MGGRKECNDGIFRKLFFLSKNQFTTYPALWRKTTAENCQMLCKDCNRRKSAK
ncbi:MAG: HNH endonuclease [Planctomycetaceae bacterium]|nr:HNH endonuclease [Planctomycetaceae bacterium]